MRCMHIVGRKNHGKSSLTTDLIAEFGRRGLRVGSIKHTCHEYPLDKPGSDSDRHREAGARPAAFVTVSAIAAHIPLKPGDDFYEKLEPLYADCNLVLVEGHLSSPGPKIEVWRAAMSAAPLAVEHGDILAVVTDDELPKGIERWARSDVPRIADRILDAIQIETA